MEKKMTFNYFYGTEADLFSFYRIPKALFTDSYFKDLSSDAKILYGLMLDRMSLSIKNQWFDDKNRAYIYFSIEDIMELLNCGRNKAIKSMRELDDETGIGLIEKRRQGFGKVNVIYVKTFMPEKTDEKKFEEELKKFKKQTSVENEEPAEVYNSNFMKSQNQTSRSPENKLQEVYISNPNNTNLSDTEMNDNKSNQIVSADENRSDSDNRSEDYQAYENLVKETIDYESLEVTHHDDMRQIDEVVNLIVETVMCKNDKILIASNWYPASLVKKKSKALDLELTSSSILIETGGKKMKKLLIIYYSWSNGNTERIAKMLQSETDSDILKIDTVVPYSGSYDDVVNQGQNEVQRGYEPEIKPLDINIADYDVIAVGTPTWWYTMAPAVKTFLHQQDFTGKTVVPFMTNGGWPGHVIKDMKAACKGANVVCDMQIQFDSTGGSNLETPQEQINEWIQSVKNLL